MPSPYRARLDVRQFLNFPGFHDSAYVVAYVEDTSGREVARVRSPWPPGRPAKHVNPQPRLILELADCANRINLEFELDTELRYQNSLHKLDTLIAALRAFRRGLVMERELYLGRVEAVRVLNAKRRRRRSGRGRGRGGL